MPAPIEPPALARLVDFAERPRTDDWSLRAALVRYAQPAPVRVGALLEVVRRVEWALQPHLKRLEAAGPEVWAAFESGTESTDPDEGLLLGLLGAMARLDAVGELLVAWALDAAGPGPGAEVDAVTAEVAEQLDALGVGREERVPPSRRRG